MAIERERKFLVKKELLPNFTESHQIFQAYLPAGDALSLRLRIMDVNAFLNIKGPDDKGVRPEFEFEINKDVALEMISTFQTNSLSKIRHIIYYEGYKWEVDEFLDKNEGLWLAEVEFQQPDEEISIPEWVDTEVTGNPLYHNSFLATK